MSYRSELISLAKQYEDLFKYGDDARGMYRRWTKFISDVNIFSKRYNQDADETMFLIDNYFEGIL
jgi:hypothetical protein